MIYWEIDREGGNVPCLQTRNISFKYEKVSFRDTKHNSQNFFSQKFRYATRHINDLHLIDFNILKRETNAS